MASLDWHLSHTGDVTLVELVVESEFDQQVCIESELTPVWPPRRHGTPLAGWQTNRFEGTVGTNQPLLLGYATPAAPTEPPARLTETTAPEENDAVTPREIVQTLGTADPPRDTLQGQDSQTPANSTSDEPSMEPPISAPTDTRHESSNESPHTQSDQTATQATENSPQAWFDAVERRLSTVETLARTADADEARTAVEQVGGIDEVRALQAQLDADRRRIQEIQRRSATMSEQLSAVELPLATLERIV